MFGEFNEVGKPKTSLAKRINDFFEPRRPQGILLDRLQIILKESADRLTTRVRVFKNYSK